MQTSEEIIKAVRSGNDSEASRKFASLTKKDKQTFVSEFIDYELGTGQQLQNFHISPLGPAILHGCHKTVAMLLDNGSDPDKIVEGNSKNAIELFIAFAMQSTVCEGKSQLLSITDCLAQAVKKTKNLKSNKLLAALTEVVSWNDKNIFNCNSRPSSGMYDKTNSHWPLDHENVQLSQYLKVCYLAHVLLREFITRGMADNADKDSCSKILDIFLNSKNPMIFAVDNQYEMRHGTRLNIDLITSLMNRFNSYGDNFPGKDKFIEIFKQQGNPVGADQSYIKFALDSAIKELNNPTTQVIPKHK